MVSVTKAIPATLNNRSSVGFSHLCEQSCYHSEVIVGKTAFIKGRDLFTPSQHNSRGRTVRCGHCGPVEVVSPASEDLGQTLSL